MRLEVLQNEMITAMKNKDKTRKNVLAGMVDAVKKAAIDKNCRDNITDELVNEVLLKYKKTVQEQIETCPADRVEMLDDYKAQMTIVTEFAPSLMTDENEIRLAILNIINNEIELSKANKGKIMKLIAPAFKGKADMSVVNKVVGAMFN